MNLNKKCKRVDKKQLLNNCFFDYYEVSREINKEREAGQVIYKRIAYLL